MSDTLAAAVTRIAKAAEQAYPAEKRHQARLQTDEEALLRWTDFLGCPHEETVRIVNVSENGLAFIATAGFRPGHAATIRTQTGSIDCIARHVTALKAPAAGQCIGAEVILSSNPTDIGADLRNLAGAASVRREDADKDSDQEGGRSAG